MKKIIILFVVLFSLTSFSQTNTKTVDSLLNEFSKAKQDTSKVNLLNKLSSSYQQIDLAKSDAYARKALSLSQKIKFDYGTSVAYLNIGLAYFSNADFPKALQHYNKALNSNPPKKIEGKILKNIGNIYLKQSDYAKSLDYFFKSLKINEEINNKQEATSSLINIGAVYSELSQYKKAIDIYQKALKTAIEINHKKYIAILYENIGLAHTASKEFEKALVYFKKAIEIYEELGDESGKSICYGAIASNYSELKDYEKALEYVNKSLSITKVTENDFYTAYSYGIAGNSYLEMAKQHNNNQSMLDKALFEFNEGLKIHKKLENLDQIAYTNEMLSEVEKLKGNYRQSLEHYQQFKIFTDSIFNSENKETIKNLEDKREIELRDKQIKINKLSLEAKEKQKWYFIFGLLLLGIIGSLLFYQSRNRKKTNEKLQLLNSELDEANKAKTRFFSILNHDLRSPVSNLVFFLQLQKESPEMLDEESKKRMQDKTMAGAENLLNSMEDILQWSKSQMENFKPQPKKIHISSLFEDTQKHFSSEEKINITFENKDNIDLKTDENYLKTIIRNLTGNAIKALKDVENPTIIWKAWKENNHTHLSITDNGSGASQEQFKALYDEKEVMGIKSGLGLHLIRDLAKAIDCEIEVKTKKDLGTTITLKL